MLSSCSAVELAIRWASTITPLSLPADSLSYDSLHAAVSALSHNPPLPSAFQLGYDDEGDFVRISTDSELRLLLTESERRLTRQQRILVDVVRDASDSDDSDDHDSDSFVKVEAADFSPQPYAPSSAAATPAAAQQGAPNSPSPLSAVQLPSPPVSSPSSNQPPAMKETAETAHADVQQERKESAAAAEHQEEAKSTAAETANLSSGPGVTGSSGSAPFTVRLPSRAPLPVAAPVAGGDSRSATRALLCRLLQGLSYCVVLAVVAAQKKRQRLTLRRVVKRSVRLVVVGALLFCCLQSYFGTRRQLSALQQHVRSQYRTIAAHTQELSELSLLSYKDWIGMLDSERAVLADTREEVNALRLQLQTQQEIIRGMQAQLEAARTDQESLNDAAAPTPRQEGDGHRGLLWHTADQEMRDLALMREWDVDEWEAELPRAEREQHKGDGLRRSSRGSGRSSMLEDIEELYGPLLPKIGASSRDEKEARPSRAFSEKRLQPHPASSSASSSSFSPSSSSSLTSLSRSQSRASAGSGSIQAAPWFSGRSGRQQGKSSSSSSSSCSSSPSSSSCGRHHHDNDDEHSELFSSLDSLPRLHHKHAKHMSRMSKKIGKAVQHVSDTAKRVWKKLF